MVEYLSLLHVGCHQLSCLIYGVGGGIGVGWGCVYIFFSLPFLVNVSVEALLIILHTPCQIQLQLCTSSPEPIPAHLGSVPIFFPGYMSLGPLPVHFLPTLWFDQEVLTEPRRSPAFLAPFLTRGN